MFPRRVNLPPLSAICQFHTWVSFAARDEMSDIASNWARAAPDPENCHLNVKKLPKTWHFFQQKKCQKCSFKKKKLPLAIFLKKMKNFGNFLKKMSSFWQFFDSQMAIFRRVRSELRNAEECRIVIESLPKF